MTSTKSTSNNTNSKNTLSTHLTAGYTRNDRQELAGLARNLRRAKRQMFLKEVEAPQTSVESFRALVTTSLMSELVDEPLLSSAEFAGKKLADSPSRRDTSLKSNFQQVRHGPRAA